METSRVNLATLVVALIAGLVVLHDALNLLASVAGLTLLVALFAFDQDGVRTGMQSIAFALVCGLAALCTCFYPLNAVLPALGLSPAFLAQYFPAVFWLLGAAIFWAIDRSRAESGQTRPVSLSAYTPPVAFQPQAAPRPAYETRPFTPAPVVVSAPEPAPPPAQPEPVYATAAPESSTPASSIPVASPLPPAPPPPATVSTAAAPVPPVRSGKEVSIYVTMLGEGMNVLRAVRAEHLGRDFYMIVDEMPADENWQYVPGQVVRCKKKNLSNGKGMVAYEEAPRAQQ
jgi:hypothetical protein